MRHFDVAVCLNESYVMPTTVLICSIGCNKDIEDVITIHALSDYPLSSNAMTILQDECCKYGFDIKFYDYSISKDNLFSKLPTGRFSLETYLKMFLPLVLPSELNKVLYLDGDMIVRHSLWDLYSEDIQNYAIAGVRDVSEFVGCIEESIHYDHNLYEYINAGVLLMNLDYHRKNNVIKRYVDYIIANYSRLFLADQDVFNNVLYREKKIVDVKYNIHFLRYFKKYKNYSPISKRAKRRAFMDPYIIHYTGPSKPWYSYCLNPYSREWDKYVKKTVFANYVKRNIFHGFELFLQIIRFYLIKPIYSFRYIL